MSKQKQKLPTESQVQQAIFAECRLRANNNSKYGLVVGYPAQRGNDFIWLQIRVGEGLTKGFPDILVLHAARGFHGAFVELKVGARVSPEQKVWCERLREQGYFADVMRVTDSSNVISFLSWYFGEQEDQRFRSSCLYYGGTV